MELPKLTKPDRYVGLYIIDFGDHAGVGFTAEEIAEILESDKYKDVKVYKIHRALPDGAIEMAGVPADRFHLESGMFFHCSGLDTAQADFDRLTSLAVTSAPPCRAKVHLVETEAVDYLVALIYPAEFEQEVSAWLLANDYRTAGAVEAGPEAVQRYYDRSCGVLDRHQLFGRSEHEIRTGDELLAGLRLAIQR